MFYKRILLTKKLQIIKIEKTYKHIYFEKKKIKKVIHNTIEQFKTGNASYARNFSKKYSRARRGNVNEYPVHHLLEVKDQEMKIQKSI